jgi:hypothetical protein
MDAALRVGVLPAREHARRPRLWAALESAYPVRLQAREPDALRELDAIIAIGPCRTLPPGLPALLALGEETPGDRPGPSAKDHEPPRATRRTLALSTDAALARPLHGAHLSDSFSDSLPTVGPGERVLATLDGAPAWVLADIGGAEGRGEGRVGRAGPDGGPWQQRVGCVPLELGEHEALRERLRPGRCLALLALVHFLRGLTAAPATPPQRAAFVIDDPNLRRPRYGHIDYAELLRDARRRGYHVSIAMVPLDGRLAHARATRVFRVGAANLSLCVHGNDHDGPELGRPRSRAQSLALVAQATRRIASFERLTGLPVERIMAPPHERLSEPVAHALRACGFHGVTTTRPYPWVASTPAQPWLARPHGAGPLAAWGPVDLVAGGLPILLRADFDHPREDLVLRAFLGQPLILYGHHDLLAHGPDRLAEAAAQIERLGGAYWCSLATIAHACVAAHAKDGVTDDARSASSDSAHSRHLPDTPARVEPPLDERALAAIPPPPRRLRPLARRLLSEGRDRAAALAQANARSSNRS